MKKVKLVIAVLATCMASSIVSLSPNQKVGKVWLAITHVMSKNGASANATTAVGAIGIMDAAVWGFAVGSVATPVVGMAAGAAASL